MRWLREGCEGLTSLGGCLKMVVAGGSVGVIPLGWGTASLVG